MSPEKSGPNCYIRVVSPQPHLHFCSAWRHDFGVIHPNLSLGHLVQTLQYDTLTLSHLLNPTQISESKGGGGGGGGERREEEGERGRGEEGRRGEGREKEGEVRGGREREEHVLGNTTGNDKDWPTHCIHTL